MAEHTNGRLNLRHQTGVIYAEANGTRIAKMCRDERRTSPVERDANAQRFVRIWNLWPDVEEFLGSFLTIGGLRSSPEAREQIRAMLVRMVEEVT